MITLEYINQEGALIVEVYESAMDLHAAGIEHKENGAQIQRVEIGGQNNE